MKSTYIVDGVPIEVHDVKINDYGGFEDWRLFIGSIEVSNSCDFLSKWVIDELENKIMKEYLYNKNDV